MRRPRLSIRAAVMAAIVLGMVLPAVVFVQVDQWLARSTQEPLLERNRAALMTLATAAVTEPVWTLSEPALQAALRRIVAEPSVCSITVLDLQPTAKPITLADEQCAAGLPLVEREAQVLYEGQVIARLRVGFDGSELEWQLAERRRTMLLLVAAQVLVGVIVLAAVLSSRLLQPIARLKAQAGSLADPRAAEPAWPHDDELGQLGRHLATVHAQNRAFVAELEAKNAQLHDQAMHDQLTGLPNRRLLRELFGHEAAAARRDGTTLALLFIDLDRFKPVNDAHGHAVGDQLLQQFALRLRGLVRPGDPIARLGGDEFVIVLHGLHQEANAMMVAGKVVAAAGEPFELAGQPLQVGASVGVAFWRPGQEGWKDVLERADLMLYRAKAAGRGQVVIASDGH
jgi:diguanylate cyclase (GGDEF)-like protein